MKILRGYVSPDAKTVWTHQSHMDHHSENHARPRVQYARAQKQCDAPISPLLRWTQEG